MRREFLPSRSARAWLALGALALAWSVTWRLLEEEVFPGLGSLLWGGVVVYLGWCFVASFKVPVVRLLPERIESRALCGRGFVCIERSNLERVMWQKASFIRFFTRDGKGCGLSLRCLAKDDRLAVRNFLRDEWGVQDVAI